MNNAFITIEGNLTKDPVLRAVGTSTVCNFDVAVNTNSKDENGEYRTNFYECSIWGKEGEFAFTKLQKGTEITIRGGMEMVERPDANGVSRPHMRVRVSEFRPRRGQKGTDTDAKPVDVTETDDPTE